MGSTTSLPEKKGVDAALDRFASMMIERMEAMKQQGWDKPWINARSHGRPMNMSGRLYNGGNAFFLQLYGDIKAFDVPIYMTFKQAHDIGCHVVKGEKSFPILFWDFTVRDSEGKRIPKENYDTMSKEERTNCLTIPFLRQYNVFNVAQTDFPQVKPEQYQALLKRFSVGELRDEQGMYSNSGIDDMLARQSWVCPVHSVKGDAAFYSTSKDIIQVPLKVQFNRGGCKEEIYAGGMEFYSSLLHEMAHSTGVASRLNRLESGRFGDPKYAKEELVAELTSAMVGSSLGFHSKITDNSARYLDAWIAVLKEEPKFIVSLMSDVSKASEMIFQHIDNKLAIARQEDVSQKEVAVTSDTSRTQKSATPFRQFDFQALKTKVGVTDVAFALGYSLDRKAGVGRYAEMVRIEGGNKADTIIIHNPSDKAIQTFFRRDGSRGDAISLIRENLNAFNVPSSGNEWARIGSVLCKLANESVPVTEESQAIDRARTEQVFNAARYRVEPFDAAKGVPKVLSERGINAYTFQKFNGFISRIYDLENKAYKGYNVGFPYVIPGDERVVGYEMRGQGGFKSKAAGTDSHSGAWIADFSNGLSGQVQHVYFFESAFDAMAFYQHNALKLDLKSSVFVSTGGQLSDGQVKGIMSYYPNARAMDCFDNDLAGKIYGLRTACLAADIPAVIAKAPSGVSVQVKEGSFLLPEKEADVSRLGRMIDLKDKSGQWKADGAFKDWNDVVLGKRIDNAPQVNKFQRNEALAERRAGMKI